MISTILSIHPGLWTLTPFCYISAVLVLRSNQVIDAGTVTTPSSILRSIPTSRGPSTLNHHLSMSTILDIDRCPWTCHLHLFGLITGNSTKLTLLTPKWINSPLTPDVTLMALTMDLGCRLHQYYLPLQSRTLSIPICCHRQRIFRPMPNLRFAWLNPFICKSTDH